MHKLNFKVEVSINEATGVPRAAYLRVRDGHASDTREIVAGKAFADYGVDGELLGVEFLAPCTVNVLNTITAEEPDNVRRFLRGAVPHEMVCG